MTPAETITEILKSLAEKVKPGVNILELEKSAETLLTLYNARSANKGYHPNWASSPYPSILCCGINNEVAHTIPRDRVLVEGEIVKIDLGIEVDGQFADSGLTVGVGEISERDQRLLDHAKKALMIGIKEVRTGADIKNIGWAIQAFVQNRGYVVNRRLNGHGIGKAMHMEPSIPHFRVPIKETLKIVNGKKQYSYEEYELGTLQEGQIICIEPHVTFRDQVGVVEKDGWGIVTGDGRNSAMFEHMIRVTSTGPEVLTKHI